MVGFPWKVWDFWDDSLLIFLTFDLLTKFRESGHWTTYHRFKYLSIKCLLTFESPIQRQLEYMQLNRLYLVQRLLAIY